MILVGSSAWIDCFRGTDTPQAERLDALPGSELLIIGDLTLGAMLTLIAAGYGIGFTSHTIATGLLRPDLIPRSLAGPPILLTTYLLRREGVMSEPVRRLVEQVRGGKDEQR